MFRWSYGRSQKQNRILVEDENVYSIEIVPNLVFTLGDIINHYGFPSAINARLESANEGGTVDALLFIYYPNLGAEIEFRIEGGDVLAVDQFNVTSDTAGVGFKLYTPQDSIEKFIAEVYQLNGLELDRFMESVTLDWIGFDAALIPNPDRTTFYDTILIVTTTPDAP